MLHRGDLKHQSLGVVYIPRAPQCCIPSSLVVRRVEVSLLKLLGVLVGWEWGQAGRHGAHVLS